MRQYAGIGLAAGLINNISVTSMIVKGANVATTIINTSIISKQAGNAIQGNQVRSDGLMIDAHETHREPHALFAR